MVLNVSKLDGELKAAGLKIDGVDSNGKVSWTEEPTEDQLAIAEAILKNHNPTDKLKGPFKQEFLAEMVQLGDDKLAKLSKLMNDPQVGLFLQVCLNDTGAFNPILINKLKEHVLNDEDLGAAFWQDIETVYKKVQ